MATIDPQDGGYASRKLVLASACIVLLTGVAVFSAWYPAVQAVFPTLCTTTVSLVGIYSGVNALVKHISSRGGDDDTDPKP